MIYWKKIFNIRFILYTVQKRVNRRICLEENDEMKSERKIKIH